MGIFMFKREELIQELNLFIQKEKNNIKKQLNSFQCLEYAGTYKYLGKTKKNISDIKDIRKIHMILINLVRLLYNSIHLWGWESNDDGYWEPENTSPVWHEYNRDKEECSVNYAKEKSQYYIDLSFYSRYTCKKSNEIIEIAKEMIVVLRKEEIIKEEIIIFHELISNPSTYNLIRSLSMQEKMAVIEKIMNENNHKIAELTKQNEELKEENKKLKKSITASIGVFEQDGALMPEDEEIKEKTTPEPFSLAHSMNDSLFYSETCQLGKRVAEKLKKAAHEGDINKVRILLSEIKKNNGNDDLINSCGMGDSICSRFLGLGERTALMLAAKGGHVQCARILLDYKADINYRSRSNHTALDYAIENYDRDMINFLRNNGAKTGEEIIYESSPPELIIKEKEPVKTRSYTLSFTSL
jgi:hypothetical protein